MLSKSHSQIDWSGAVLRGVCSFKSSAVIVVKIFVTDCRSLKNWNLNFHQGVTNVRQEGIIRFTLSSLVLEGVVVCHKKEQDN